MVNHKALASAAVNDALQRLYGRDIEIPDDPIDLGIEEAHMLSCALAQGVNDLLKMRENVGQAVLELLWTVWRNGFFLYGGLVNETAEYNSLAEWADENIVVGNEWYVRDMIRIVERMFAPIHRAALNGEPFVADVEQETVKKGRGLSGVVVTPELLIGMDGLIARLKGASPHFEILKDKRCQILESVLFGKNTKSALAEIRGINTKTQKRVVVREHGGKYTVSVTGLSASEAMLIQGKIEEMLNANGTES
jgi:hypothetical protein